MPDSIAKHLEVLADALATPGKGADLPARAREAFEDAIDASSPAIRDEGEALDFALAAVIAVVQEDRTRATLAILDGLAERSIDEWGEGYAAALNDVRFNVIHEFGGTTP